MKDKEECAIQEINRENRKENLKPCPWTTDPPSEMGWYWLLYPKIDHPNDVSVPFIVYVTAIHNDEVYYIDRFGLRYPETLKGTKWLKIDVPAFPQEVNDE